MSPNARLSSAETAVRHDKRRFARHILAQPVAAVLLATAMLTAAACGGSITGTAAQGQTGSGGQGTAAGPSGVGGTGGVFVDTGASGGAPSGGGVPCASAQNGDPCATNGDSCGVQDSFGCTATCVANHWVVNSTCPTQPVTQLSPCDLRCDPKPCGPYTVQTTCGSETVTAQCGALGWTYPITCMPDCESVSDPTSCDATIGCVWINSCWFSCNHFSGCTSLQNNCQFAGGACPAGLTCKELYVNPRMLQDTCCDAVGQPLYWCTP